MLNFLWRSGKTAKPTEQLAVGTPTGPDGLAPAAVPAPAPPSELNPHATWLCGRTEGHPYACLVCDTPEREIAGVCPGGATTHYMGSPRRRKAGAP